MISNKVRAICLAALMLLMTSSQLTMQVNQSDEEVDFLETDSAENIQYVQNSDPMSTIDDAALFNGQVSSTIYGYNDHWPGYTSYQLNDSIATGVGGGDGFHWWKTPVLGNQFTVNYSLDDIYHPEYSNTSWEITYNAQLRITVITNSGTCVDTYLQGMNDASSTCYTPQSGGMAYIRISTFWGTDETEVAFNYTLEVAEFIPSPPPPTPDPGYHCDSDWSYPGVCDSETYSPVTLSEGETGSGTMEVWWNKPSQPSDYYDYNDYVSLTDGLPNTHRMNMTTIRTSDGPFLSPYNSKLTDCHSGSTQLSSLTYSSYLDCLLIDNAHDDPVVQISGTFETWNESQNGKQIGWSVSYVLTEIRPIEDEIYGDLNGVKMIGEGTTHYGSLDSTPNPQGGFYDWTCCDEWGNIEYVWIGGVMDGSDIYDLSLEHGYEVEFRINSDADIAIEIPNGENCNDGTVTTIQIQANMPLSLACTSVSIHDYFRVGLITTDETNGTANYSITSLVKSQEAYSGQNVLIDDIGSGKDAPAVNEYGSGSENSLLLPLGTSTGGFTHFTDLRDTFNIEIPPDEGRLVFIKADEMMIDGGSPGYGWITEGDLVYRVYQNTGSETIVQNLEIRPNDNQALFRNSDTSSLGYYIYWNWNDAYIEQGYTISVHEFDIDVETTSLYDFLNSNRPQYLGDVGNINIPEYPGYEPSNPLEDWNLDMGSYSPQTILMPLEFDPTKALKITATQASDQPIGLYISGTTSMNTHNEVNLAKYYDGKVDQDNMYSNNLDKTWSHIQLSGLDGSRITISTEEISAPSTRESDTWMASPGLMEGTLGTSSDEGLDTSDYWTFTIMEDIYYEFTLETDEELQAYISGAPWSNDQHVYTGCWPGNDWGTDTEYESTNISFNVVWSGGMGDYDIRYTRDGDCSYSNHGFSGSASSSIASPGEDIFFPIYDEVTDEDYELEIVDVFGDVVDEMNIQNIDSYNIRASIPSNIEIGGYDIRLTYDGLVVDTMQIHIVAHGEIFAHPTTGYGTGALGPGESPAWSIDVAAYGEETPGEWDFLIAETWMRDIDGTPIDIDTNLATAPGSTVEDDFVRTDLGRGIVETVLPSQPRPGAKIYQTCSLESTENSLVWIPDDTFVTSEWVVSHIDLTLSNPIGTSTPEQIYYDDVGYVSQFTTSSENPSNDIFYTVNARVNGIPIEGIAGMANLRSTTRSDVLQAQQFVTDEWGQASLMFDYSTLPTGNYTVVLDVFEEWDAWMDDIRHFSIFSIQSNWQDDGFEIETDERDFDLIANIRRNTLVAGESIEVDWTIESDQELSDLSWTLVDSASRVLLSETTLQSGSEGLLEIAIPDSLDISLHSTIYICARGVYGSTDCEWFQIQNIAEQSNLVVNIQPDLARPGDILTIDLELDSEIEYIFWDWTLTEQGNPIAEGNGWESANAAEFEIELERRNLQNLNLRIDVIDGNGRTYVSSQSIELRDLVELTIQSSFSTNAGETLSVSWEIDSPSLTLADKGSNIAVSLTNIGTQEDAYQYSELVDDFKGNIGVDIPSDIRPGTYLLTVDVETADGRILTSQSVIDIDEPQSKNMFLGMEIPAWSSMWNGFAILFLIGNLIAIWTVIYKRRDEDASTTLFSQDDEFSDFDEQESENYEDDFSQDSSEDYSYESAEYVQSTESLQTPTESLLTPAFSLTGEVHDDGFEWLMYPEDSGCWWYRREVGTEWIRL